jgi:heme/copper-type cytochrome/quinol oxidase subunit 3
VNIAGLTRMRWLLGTLLIAAAALFAIGVANEGDAHDETVASVEAGEHNEHAEASETGEELFSVNLESAPLVVLAVISSVALAAATWKSDHKLILLVTALFAAAFAILDVAEFSHQIRESATTIAALAAVIAVLHTAAALLAEQRRGAAAS